MQPVCLLPPRVAGSGCTGFHFFSFPPRIQVATRGVSASAGQPDELPEGIKAGVKNRIDRDCMIALLKKPVVDEPRGPRGEKDKGPRGDGRADPEVKCLVS